MRRSRPLGRSESRSQRFLYFSGRLGGVGRGVASRGIGMGGVGRHGRVGSASPEGSDGRRGGWARPEDRFARGGVGLGVVVGK